MASPADGIEEGAIRALGGELSQYQGKRVCVVGTVIDTSHTSSGYKILSSDDVEVVIKLHDVPAELPAGLVQVEGIAAGQNCIEEEEIMEWGQNEHEFDKDSYNQAVRCAMNNADLYPMSRASANGVETVPDFFYGT